MKTHYHMILGAYLNGVDKMLVRALVGDGIRTFLNTEKIAKDIEMEHIIGVK